MTIKFGPGGTSGLGYIEIFPALKKEGLEALEIEFTYGVRMKREEAIRIGELARKNRIILSIHAPYYINLASPEPEKVKASITRIMDSCEKGHLMGARYIVFHAGFYMGRPSDQIYSQIKDRIKEMQKIIINKGWKTKLAPEVTGKPTQFGNLQELLLLRKETGCHLTVDFSHLLARNNGIIDYGKIFESLTDLDEIHGHFSGIEWTEKGEKRHRRTLETDILPLAKAAKMYKGDITLINESPDPIVDAKLMKAVFNDIL